MSEASTTQLETPSYAFSAGLGHLFREWDLPDRFALALEHGFDGVELTLPYETSAQALAQARERSGAEVVLFTAPVGDFMAGGEGLAAVPGQQAAFRDAMQIALEYAQALQAKYVQVVVGRCKPVAGEADRQAMYLDTLASNLAYAIELFGPTQTRVVIEGINSLDFPDFLLSTPDQLHAFVGRVGAARLGAVCDTAHLARMGIAPEREILANGGRYCHLQVADSPGRSAPGSAAVDFQAIFQAIRSSGYAGWIGAEYHPAADTGASLGWLGQARAILNGA
jgi:hydroxypyruvate isomerase